MTIIVSGSIVYDSIGLCARSLRDQIVVKPGRAFGVTLRPEVLRRYFGGAGANIAYNLRVLGESPVLAGLVGDDFAAYATWLDRHQISRDWIHVVDGTSTASCVIVADGADDRLTVFDAGAMDTGVAALPPSATVGVIAPSSKPAMLEHARMIKRSGARAVIDAGPAVTSFDAAELRELLDGATIYAVNEREWHLTCTISGLEAAAIARMVDTVVITRGGEPTTLLSRDGASEIAAVRPDRIVDPVGCGDAHRAGIAYALEHGLGIAAGVRLGALLGALKIAERGPQSIPIDPRSVHERYARMFGAVELVDAVNREAHAS